jgi:DNA replication protein DnaC
MITSNSAAPLSYQVPFRCERAQLVDLDAKMRSAVEAGLTGLGAMFCGPTGTGKTYAMVAGMRALGRGGFDLEPLFVDWPEFIGDCDRFERRFKGVEDAEKFDPFRRLCTYRGPLFVDDVGQDLVVVSGFKTNVAESAFDQFVNRRTGMELPLWITSNLAEADIQARYGERTVSRLSQHCLIVPVVGEDRRLSA